MKNKFNYLKYFYFNIIKQKILHWLGLITLTNEVHYNFIHINALEEYIKNESAIEEQVKIQCKKYNIVDLKSIEQIIKNQKIKNYLDYNNKILLDSMKEIPQKIEGDDLKFII